MQLIAERVGPPREMRVDSVQAVDGVCPASVPEVDRVGDKHALFDFWVGLAAARHLCGSRIGPVEAADPEGVTGLSGRQRGFPADHVQRPVAEAAGERRPDGGRGHPGAFGVAVQRAHAHVVVRIRLEVPDRPQPLRRFALNLGRALAACPGAVVVIGEVLGGARPAGRRIGGRAALIGGRRFLVLHLVAVERDRPVRRPGVIVAPVPRLPADLRQAAARGRIPPDLQLLFARSNRQVARRVGSVLVADDDRNLRPMGRFADQSGVAAFAVQREIDDERVGLPVGVRGDSDVDSGRCRALCDGHRAKGGVVQPSPRNLSCCRSRAEVSILCGAVTGRTLVVAQKHARLDIEGVRRRAGQIRPDGDRLFCVALFDQEATTPARLIEALVIHRRRRVVDGVRDADAPREFHRVGLRRGAVLRGDDDIDPGVRLIERDRVGVLDAGNVLVAMGAWAPIDRTMAVAEAVVGGASSDSRRRAGAWVSLAEGDRRIRVVGLGLDRDVGIAGCHRLEIAGGRRSERRAGIQVVATVLGPAIVDVDSPAADAPFPLAQGGVG